MTETRTAECLCQGIKVKVSGDPKFSIICHCNDCQKRTGSVFGYGCFFPKTHVEIEGVTRSYSRAGDSGGICEINFCETCGSTVYWTAESTQGLIAISGGCFAPGDFPEPKASVWERSKIKWVEIPKEWKHSDTQA